MEDADGVVGGWEAEFFGEYSGGVGPAVGSSAVDFVHDEETRSIQDDQVSIVFSLDRVRVKGLPSFLRIVDNR